MKHSKLFLLILMFSLALHLTVNAQEKSSCEVLQVSGKAKILPSEKTVWKKAEVGMSLETGDLIKTYDKSFLEVSFNKKKSNTIKIGPKSVVVLKLKKGEKIELIDGEVFARINKLPRGSSFVIRTPIASCGARGTEYKVSSKKEESLTELSVLQEKVLLESVKEPFKSVVVNELEKRNICPWKKSIIDAKGAGIPSRKIDVKDKKIIKESDYIRLFSAQDIINGKRAAKVDAHRKLALKIYGVVIDSKTTLNNYAEKDKKVKVTVNGLVRGAKEVKTDFYSNGLIEVTMKVKAKKLKKSLEPITGNIFGIDCISGPDKLKKSDLKEFLL